jgi:hypothetical protein
MLFVVNNNNLVINDLNNLMKTLFLLGLTK